MRRTLVLAALLVVACASAGRAAEPAAGGRALLRGAETATATVAGTVRAPARVDLHGYAAVLEVERVLAGELVAGARQRIAWEELATRRPPRFAEGDRVLVALEPLPAGSLWSSRFPKRDTLAVAAKGRAFLRAPDGRTVELLASYLALEADARDRAAGVEALARLAGGGDLVVSRSAISRLREVPGLGDKLNEAARAALAHAIGADGARPRDLRIELLGLAGQRGLQALRPAIEPLAEPAGPLEAPALAALAELDGGLAPERTRALLARSEPDVRAVALRHGAGGVARDRLAGLVRSDPAPEVRAAALEVLLARHGASVLDLVSPALFDPEPAVRASAASRIGALGAAAVPRLRGLAAASAGSDAAGPLAALWYAGPEGRAAVHQLARSHPDEQARNLCLLLMGRDPRDPH